MSEEWQYQIRIDMPEDVAALARHSSGDPALAPLPNIIAKHNAELICQYDAFAGYCAEAEANGVEDYPLYDWTKATIEDPAKKEKYLKSFTLYVDGDQVYSAAEADALEADLQPLVGGKLVVRLSKYDTNPANNPQPPKRGNE